LSNIKRKDIILIISFKVKKEIREGVIKYLNLEKRKKRRGKKKIKLI